MPQMSLMKWTIIMLMSMLNLFNSIILINSMPKKLNYNVKFKYKFNNWNWSW